MANFQEAVTTELNVIFQNFENYFRAAEFYVKCHFFNIKIRRSTCGQKTWESAPFCFALQMTPYSWFEQKCGCDEGEKNEVEYNPVAANGAGQGIFFVFISY